MYNKNDGCDFKIVNEVIKVYLLFLCVLLY